MAQALSVELPVAACHVSRRGNARNCIYACDRDTYDFSIISDCVIAIARWLAISVTIRDNSGLIWSHEWSSYPEKCFQENTTGIADSGNSIATVFS
jgi:hypothetical protein